MRKLHAHHRPPSAFFWNVSRIAWSAHDLASLKKSWQIISGLLSLMNSILRPSIRNLSVEFYRTLRIHFQSLVMVLPTDVLQACPPIVFVRLVASRELIVEMCLVCSMVPLVCNSRLQVMVVSQKACLHMCNGDRVRNVRKIIIKDGLQAPSSHVHVTRLAILVSTGIYSVGWGTVHFLFYWRIWKKNDASSFIPVRRSPDLVGRRFRMNCGWHYRLLPTVDHGFFTFSIHW